MAQTVHEPKATQPDEPGWWIASDGKWYPPETQPADTREVARAAETLLPATSVTAAQAGNGLAVAALVLGIIGVVFGILIFTFWVAGILGILSLVLGLVGRSRATREARSGKGMATTGAILGALSLVLAALGVVVLVGVLNGASDAIQRSVGRANPTDYRLGQSSCGLDADGFAHYEGQLTNTANTNRSFEITIHFKAADGTQLGDGSDFVTDLTPGSAADVSATKQVRDTPATCPAVVDNFFNH